MKTAQTFSEFIQLNSPSLAHQEPASKSDALLYVKGFASISGLDAHGMNLDARKFELEDFRRNGQLWLNHELYRRPETGTFVPIGRVEKANIGRVEVQKDANGGINAFTVVDDETGEPLDTITSTDAERFSVKDGDLGLWVVAAVLEKEPASLVLDGRLNAFSWAGMLVRNPAGTVKRLIIRELSLVFMPANTRALFMVGKSDQSKAILITENGVPFDLNENVSIKGTLRTIADNERYRILFTTNEGHLISKKVTASCMGDVLSIVRAEAERLSANQDLATIALYEFAGCETEDGALLYKTCAVFFASEVEGEGEDSTKQIILSLCTEDEAALMGLHDMTKVLTKQERDLLKQDTNAQSDAIANKEGGEPVMDEILKALNAMKSELTEKLGSLTERLSAIEKQVEGEPETAETPPTDSGTVEAPPAEPPADAEATADVGAGETQDAPAADTGEAADAGGEEVALGILKTLSEQMNAQMKSFGERLSKIEGRTAPSRANDDENVDAVSIKKALDEMSQEDRRKLQKAAIGRALFTPRA